MKKKFLVIVFAAVFCLAGCSGEDKPAKSTTDEVDKYAQEMEEGG